MDLSDSSEPSNAIVPFSPPSLPLSLPEASRKVATVKVKKKKVKAERKDKTMWDDTLTRLFLYNRLALRDSDFKGKSVPKDGLMKVLDKMKKEEPDLVKEKHVTVPALLNKWNKLMNILKCYQDNQSQTGACSIDPPQYYDLMLDCLGTEGRVAVDGAAYARDSGRGTKRVGRSDDITEDDVLADCPLVESSFTDKEQNSCVKDDESSKTPTKRLSRRERQKMRTSEAGGNNLAICQAIENSAKLLNEGANARHQSLQETLREAEEKRMAEVKQQYEVLALVFGKKVEKP